MTTKTRARTLAVATAAFFLVALGLPPASEAQQVELTGHTGMLTPTSDLLSGDGDAGGSTLGTGVPFGATLGVRFETGIGLEASGIKAFDVAVEGDQILAENADFSALTGHLTYTVPMGEGAPVVSPMFGLGLGVRNIDYAEVTDGEPVVDDASDFTGVGQVGLVFAPNNWIGARAEGRLYLSSYEAFDEANGQQDLAFLAGITIRTPE